MLAGINIPTLYDRKVWKAWRKKLKVGEMPQVLFKKSITRVWLVDHFCIKHCREWCGIACSRGGKEHGALAVGNGLWRKQGLGTLND